MLVLFFFLFSINFNVLSSCYFLIMNNKQTQLMFHYAEFDFTSFQAHAELNFNNVNTLWFVFYLLESPSHLGCTQWLHLEHCIICLSRLLSS